MLTQKYFDQIEKIVEKSIKDSTKHLPTRDQFYSKMDYLIGEIKASREEHTAITGRMSDNSDTLEKHEKRLIKIEETITSNIPS